MSLSSDLKQLRESQHLSIDDIHKESKLAVYIIESIENGLLFEDEQKNITYQRSYVRTYAKALKLADSEIVKALDQFFSGEYNGFLLTEFDLKKSSSTPNSSNEKEASEKTSVNEAKTEENFESEEVKSKTVVERPIEPTPFVESTTTSSPTTTPNKPRKVVPGFESDSISSSSHVHHAYDKTKVAPSVNSVNWANINTDKPKKPVALKPILILTIAFLVISAGGYGIYSYLSNPDVKTNAKPITSTTKVEKTPEEKVTEETPKTSNPSQTDVIQPIQNTEANPVPGTNDIIENTVETTPMNSNKQENTNVTLPDTLSILVFAATDKLEPVRIKTDLTDSYFPYWIEKGTAMRFTFTTDVFVKGQYDRMAILLNEKAYLADFKNFRAANREIHITREIIESQKNSYLNPENAIQSNSLPLPKKVIDRPVF